MSTDLSPLTLATIGAGLIVLIAVLVLVLAARSRRARNHGRRAHAQQAETPDQEPAPDHLGMWLLILGIPVLLAVMGIGAVTSFASLRTKAAPYLHDLAVVFPLSVDGTILGCTFVYVAIAKRSGKRVASLRWLAWAGIAATIYFNASTASDLTGIGLHVWGPMMWGVLCEVAANLAVGRYRVEHDNERERTDIDWQLWAGAPINTLRIRLHLARNPRADFDAARDHVAVLDAAKHMLRMHVVDVDGITGRARPARKLILRQVRSGLIDPAQVVHATDPAAHDGKHRAPDVILREILGDVLTGRVVRRARPATTRTVREPARTAAQPAAPAAPAADRAKPQPAPVVFDQDDVPAAALAQDVDPYRTGYVRGQLVERRDLVERLWRDSQRSDNPWNGNHVGHVLGVVAATGRREIQKYRDLADQRAGELDELTPHRPEIDEPGGDAGVVDLRARQRA